MGTSQLPAFDERAFRPDNNLHVSTPSDVLEAIEYLSGTKFKAGEVHDKANTIQKYLAEVQHITVEAKAKLRFKFVKGRPMLFVKIGDRNRGWVPNEAHFTRIQHDLKASGADEIYNVILFHYAIETSEIHPPTQPTSMYGSGVKGYRKIATHDAAFLESNGANIEPKATLEDGYGARAHIATDDHCYVLYQKVGEDDKGDSVRPVTHWFEEALQILRTLPNLY